MRVLPLALSLVMLAGCALPPKAAEQAAMKPEARIQQIPAADAQQYAGMKDMKAWRNPYLIVKADGIGLLDAANNEQQKVNADKVAEALARLPASAWPYGRVVAIQESSAATESEKTDLRRNRALLAGTLEDLHVAIQWVQ